ncbi:MAG: hypothetical protein ACOC59_02605 [Bacteroidota bacterium]
MPILQLPTNDMARLEFIKHAVTTAGNDFDTGSYYISRETYDGLTKFVPVFEERIYSINALLGRRSREVQESSEAFGKMEACMRDMWEVLRRRVNRLGQPAQVLAYYELPLDGLTPRPTTYDEWYAMAAKMVGGDAKAVQDGYPAMQNPSAQELNEALEKARAERADISVADRKYDRAQEGVEELRAKADELISDVMADLRYFLRKMDKASQRRIMRSYGVVFKYLKGEPEEEMPEEEVE